MKPNFLLIGAMKCATTTWWEVLRRHPQIFMSAEKEPSFFSWDYKYGLGEASYLALFRAADGKLAIGEASTGYTKKAICPKASDRIAKHLPDAKLIYIVRNPIARIESHWRHEIARGEKPSLEELLRRPHVVDISCYWRQISAYRAHFPDERILVLFLEDFVRDPNAVLRRCFEFLQVDAALGKYDPKLSRHVVKDSLIDGPINRLIRKLPGVQSIKRAAPELSTALASKLRRPAPSVQWPAKLLPEIIGQLAEDSALFLRHYGKPPDYWQLD